MLAKRTIKARPRRAIVLPIFIVLTLTTGIALLGLAQLLVAGPAPNGVDHIAPSVDVAAIRAFYAAANRTLQTGDPGPLDALISPHLVDHQRPDGSVVGRAELVQHLVTLHAGFPEAQFVIDDLVAQADEVVARVHLADVTPGQFENLALPAALADWEPIDIFRLAGGVIVEHWGDQASAVALRPLQQATLSLTYAANVTSAARLNFKPSDTFRSDSMAGPKLLYVESGRLTVTITWARQDPAAWLHPKNGDTVAGIPVRPDHAVTLGPDDLLALSQDAIFTATSGAGGTTSCLAMSPQIFPPFVHEAIYGPRVQRLADNLPDPIPSGSVATAIGDVTLAPGASLQFTTAAGSTLVVDESGRLGMTMAAGGAWIQHGADGATETLGWLSGEAQGIPVKAVGGLLGSPRSQSTPAPATLPPATTLAPRDTALVEPGASGIVHNAGDSPLSLLVVSLTPDQAAAGTPVPGRRTP